MLRMNILSPQPFPVLRTGIPSPKIVTLKEFKVTVVKEGEVEYSSCINRIKLKRTCVLCPKAG